MTVKRSVADAISYLSDIRLRKQKLGRKNQTVKSKYVLISGKSYRIGSYWSGE